MVALAEASPPAPQPFALPSPARPEAEWLATLLAETERDLARLVPVLDWMDNDNEPSLGAPALNPGWTETYDQTAWGMGGRAGREVGGPGHRWVRRNDI